MENKRHNIVNMFYAFTMILWMCVYMDYKYTIFVF